MLFEHHIIPLVILSVHAIQRPIETLSRKAALPTSLTKIRADKEITFLFNIYRRYTDTRKMNV